MHVTLRMADHVWNLRTKRCFRPVRVSIDGGHKTDFRIVHYSVQRNHVHLIVEADDKKALARGVQGLCVRIAHRLNHVMHSSGGVFADRYHARLLRTPTEVHRALGYVLNNVKKHWADDGYRRAVTTLDPFSSAASFDGWEGRGRLRPPPWMKAHAGAAPQSWVLRGGWRRAKPAIAVTYIPGGWSGMPS